MKKANKLISTALLSCIFITMLLLAVIINLSFLTTRLEDKSEKVLGEIESLHFKNYWSGEIVKSKGVTDFSAQITNGSLRLSNKFVAGNEEFIYIKGIKNTTKRAKKVVVSQKSLGKMLIKINNHIFRYPTDRNIFYNLNPGEIIDVVVSTKNLIEESNQTTIRIDD